MRVPVSWLTENLETKDKFTPDQIADAFVRVGLEVEDVTPLGPVTGPVVVGRVAEIEELKEFKKPIRYCMVEVIEADDHDETMGPRMRGIICGATNFTEGDLVVVALPGAVLPGGFEITKRRTYGHDSDGMICSARELGLGDEHSGILVLPSGEAGAGDDAVELLGLDETVIELAITPDRGYAFSIRGLARELACAFNIDYRDHAAIDVPEPEGDAYPVKVEDSEDCLRFVVRRITGVDPTSPTPWWLRQRLMLAGIRSISLAVDVTNYVMLEMGQPMHAFDTPSIKGTMVVRRAEKGEKLTTLDDVERELDPDDIVIADDTGPISLAGVMGGASTEVRSDSTDILLEAASWNPTQILRSVRRHKLPSEASKRFERRVDTNIAPMALERAARLLRDHADGSIQPGRTDVGGVTPMPMVAMPIGLPDQVAGVRYPSGATVRRLQQIGCKAEVVTGEDGQPLVIAHPPTWRPDLAEPADLVEEVLRLEGYDSIPTALPPAPPGTGLTASQRRRRAVGRALAEAGYIEVIPFPFVSPTVWDALGLPHDDNRRRTITVLNPLEADRSELATTLLPSLLDALTRNVSRGMRDVALFHIGQVTLPKSQRIPVPAVAVDGRPKDGEIAALHAALPQQPVHTAVVLAGNRERAGWWGPGQQATWSDAVRAAEIVAEAAGLALTVQAAELPPWHPGRCAQLLVGDLAVGYAGELHPKVIDALGLPKRTCAMELKLDSLPLVDRRPAPAPSPYPPVLLDVALVVDESVPVAEVATTLHNGGGELLEDIHLFDVFTGEQVGEGKRSLAYSLRFRAPDRTLTVEEATAARDAAVAAAASRYGAALRS
ncbi:phenylalanine--tRNA ligase subunit beta [Actinophytocola oryzae]|uniref:Phenylalanine--tRNA ligase beta subunit n=1 Tax=Actinophytocola oryzae TaxID=502181 RepID=A0A4R7V2D3_9PSEU|nr:phenylalanine--tRNA ligase subunit beta [Actinophytocola oryzae]TDV42722.1 phenylalanyl-tRNA synthetase beta subunit [Actinophytocola oryzae]